MPFKDVGFRRMSSDEGRWVCLNRLVFAGELYTLLIGSLRPMRRIFKPSC